MAYQIGVVLCRVAAVVLTVQVIRSTGYWLPTLFYGGSETALDWLAFALLATVPGFAAVGLWVFADRICKIDSDSEDRSEPANTIDFLRVGLALLGVYLLIDGILIGVSTETQWIALLDVQRNFGDEHQSRIAESLARMTSQRITYLVQIVLGIALIAGKERLLRLFKNARYAGIDRK